MRVGIGLPNTLKGANRDLMIAWLRKSDEGAFSSVGVFDRLVYDSLETLAVLAAAAVVTEKVKLASTILISPLRNTAILAKEAATIDVLSGGRMVLGLAVGARGDDYMAAGVDSSTRGSVLDEQLVRLREYWADDTLGPKPIQPNGPQLIIGGLSDVAFARAARYADGYIHGGGPPRAFAAVAAKARAAWLDAGRTGQPRLWAQGYYALGAAHSQAGADYLRHYYAFTGPFAERIASEMLTTPQAVAAFVRGYEEAGCDELVLYPTVADLDEVDRLAQVLG